ncbi:MAG: hypothetical protein KKE91_04640, partial [Candidatus Omnitrophica bacterium]|nr:hypothetical protein [Candidatus Omnitrophota bacterium]
MQKDINSIISELFVIIADYKTVTRDEKKVDVSQRENMLLEELRALYLNMPVEIHADKPYDFYSTLLKELKEHREEIYRKIEKADLESNKRALRDLNLEAIRNARILVKLELLIAGMFLNGKAGPKVIELRRNAALWTLQGAVFNSKILEDELRFRVQRLRGKKKIQEIETTDWIGQIVRTFRLGGFDIKVGEREGEEEPKVTVRQQRWINVKTHLVTIRRDIKRGEIKKAIKAIDMLIELYNIHYIVAMERYKDIANDLKRIKKMALGLPESHAPPKDEVKKISDEITNLTKKIIHPKQRIWVDVEFRNLGKGFRGKIKTIARYEPEYMLILKNKTNLEYYAERLKTALEKGYLSNRNREVIRNGITRLKAWVDRGFVEPKQFSAIYLQPVIDLLDSNDFEAARDYCRKTVQELEKRLQEIDSIIVNVKKRAASLYAEYRDEDITKRTNTISSSIEDKDFETALSEITELRELYFNQELVEPGYIRAEKLLRITANLVRGAARSRNPDPTIKRISSILDELKQDILHKRSFKITATREDGESRQFFINPGTTALGVLNLKNLKRDPDKTLVSIGKGWIPKDELKKVKLADGAHVLLKAKKDTGSVRATEGERLEEGLVVMLNLEIDKAKELLSKS